MWTGSTWSCWPPTPPREDWRPSAGGVPQGRPQGLHAGGRTGVIVCDAVRWDLGQKVLDRLSGPDHTVEAVAAVLPSETPFGMSALLPLEGAVRVEFEEKRVR